MQPSLIPQLHPVLPLLLLLLLLLMLPSPSQPSQLAFRCGDCEEGRHEIDAALEEQVDDGEEE